MPVISSDSFMQDLTNPRWIKIKGILFLLLGLMSGALLILDDFSLKQAALFVLSIWCFCRFYYFAFYVIEHYVDAEYRFSGLWSFLCYLLKSRARNKQPVSPP